MKGFTLIELLVVVLIIGILAAVALPQYHIAVGKARVARALPLLRALVSAKQHYYLANLSYTDDMDLLDIEVPYESKQELGIAGTIYKGTPIGIVQLARMGEGVVWIGPGLVIDTVASYQQCYSEVGNIQGEKICASLFNEKLERKALNGENLYRITF